MNNKKLIRLAESFLVLPLLTMSIPFGSVPNMDSITTPRTVLSEKLNIAGSLFALNQVNDEKAQTLQKQADAIDAYFKSHNMPLEGTGMKMAEEALKNGLDYRLLPGISARESTGGRDDCQKKENNPFGWASCKVGFDSLDQAIETVARNLGGNNPNTARHYANKTTAEILNKYNPPSIVKHYTKQVLSIMEDIGPEDVNAVPTANS